MKDNARRSTPSGRADNVSTRLVPQRIFYRSMSHHKSEPRCKYRPNLDDTRDHIPFTKLTWHPRLLGYVRVISGIQPKTFTVYPRLKNHDQLCEDGSRRDDNTSYYFDRVIGTQPSNKAHVHFKHSFHLACPHVP